MMKVESQIIELHVFRVCKSDPGDIEFLLLKRAPEEIYPKLWQMVSGRVEENESAHLAARRELLEETGLQPKKLWVAPIVNSFYNPETDTVNIIPVFAAQVERNAGVVLSEEHTQFRWAGKRQAKSYLAWQGQRNAVDIIHEYFSRKKKILKFVEIDL